VRVPIAHDRTGPSARRLPLYHFAVDALVWVIALPVTALLRFDFEWSSISATGMATAGAVAVTWQGSFGYLVGLYDRRWRYGSFEEIRALAVTVLMTGGLLTTIAFILRSADFPRSVPLLATGFTVTGTIAMRSAWRLYKDKQSRPHEAKPIVMI
jgi:FlaA1/EpsC-like NDP-sugar epimerase